METENNKIKKPSANSKSGRRSGESKKYRQHRRPQKSNRRQKEDIANRISEAEAEIKEENENIQVDKTEEEVCCIEDEPAEEISVPEKEEYEVIGVRFKQNGKVYYFDPSGTSFSRDSHVIVETARGIEYGTVTIENRVVSGKEVVLPLRKVIRKATDEDEKKHESNLKKEVEVFNICLDKIEEHKLDMKLVDVEYTFDNSKLLFYFTAEGRVDFRELVKDLASVFRTRIELWQIGIRDEAKLMGGLGVCGRPFCCASFLSDFVQVSIKMAKEQNLSLNSSKISGACGRLMCCLRYEYDTYTEEIAKTPKQDALVETPDGEGTVVEVSPLAGLCKVQLTKNPTSLQLYHRDDLKVKGYVKGKHKTAPAVQQDSPDVLKKLEEK